MIIHSPFIVMGHRCFDQAGFDLAFLSDGYAKTASAMLVAAIAEAMKPEPTIEGLIAVLAVFGQPIFHLVQSGF